MKIIKRIHLKLLMLKTFERIESERNTRKYILISK